MTAMYGAIGMPRSCNGLFNWCCKKNTLDLDESYGDSEEYNEEFRRLRGGIMPTAEYLFQQKQEDPEEDVSFVSPLNAINEDLLNYFVFPEDIARVVLVENFNLAAKASVCGIMPILLIGGAAICDPLDVF